MPRPSLKQQLQNLDALYRARQTRAEKPLTTRQAAAKMIATSIRNAKGTQPKPKR